MTIVKASSKGQIVLPKEIRQKLDIHPGQNVKKPKLLDSHAALAPLPASQLPTPPFILNPAR